MVVVLRRTNMMLIFLRRTAVEVAWVKKAAKAQRMRITSLTSAMVAQRWFFFGSLVVCFNKKWLLATKVNITVEWWWKRHWKTNHPYNSEGSCNVFCCIWKGGLQIGRPYQRVWLGACWGKVDCPSTSGDDVQGPQAQNHLQLFKELEREGRPALGLTPLKTLVLNIRKHWSWRFETFAMTQYVGNFFLNWPGRPGGSSPLGFGRSRPSTGRTHPFWCSTQAGRRSLGGEGGGGG